MHDDKPAAPRANFNYPTAYRIGCGRRRELPACAAELGIKRPLVIADPGIVSLRWFIDIRAALDRAGFDHAVFSDIQGNPVERNVTDGVEAYLRGAHDGCVIVGGGSALDAGKCVALMARHPGSVFDYEDVGDNWTRVDPQKIAPMIAMPTTSGTGSEVGRASVITDVRDHTKKIIFHPRMLPPLVLADPETTFGLPPHVTAATGVDAFVHCFEALCAPGYHPMAEGIALEGMRLIARALPRAFDDGHDAVARTDMMMASSMGATAFQKGLGLVHAMAHPLGAVTGIHHGLANAILLPFAMDHNRDVIAAPMARLAQTLSLATHDFAAVRAWVIELRLRLGIPHTLREAAELGLAPPITRAQLPTFADMATRDPSLGTNPKPCTAEEIEAVLAAALG